MESWNETEAVSLIAGLDVGGKSGDETQPSGLIPALQALQARFGYVDDGAVPLLAKHFNLSNAEIYGVVSFYHDFRKSPAGRHVIKLCQAEACQAMGARALTEHIKAVLGLEFGETTPSHDFSLEPVYCLGNCACAPAMMVGNHVHGRVDAGRFDAILEEIEAEDVP